MLYCLLSKKDHGEKFTLPLVPEIVLFLLSSLKSCLSKMKLTYSSSKHIPPPVSESWRMVLSTKDMVLFFLDSSSFFMFPMQVITRFCKFHPFYLYYHHNYLSCLDYSSIIPRVPLLPNLVLHLAIFQPIYHTS